MDTKSEPPQKKAKFMETKEVILSNYIDDSIEKIKTSCTNLTPIISDLFTEPIPSTEVYTATIKNPKDISKVISVLNRKYLLKDLQHLKRVRKKEIIIVPVKTITPERIEVLVKENLAEFEDVFADYKVVNVPALPPKLKWQFEESDKLWPCNFHPNKYNERLFSGDFFKEKELSMHRMFMEVVFEVLRIKLTDKLNDSITINKLSDHGVAVVVDPTIQSIVAVTFDCRNEHPLQHAAMLAIDNVARTQNGGSWAASANKSPDVAFRGVNEELLLKLKGLNLNLKFGAKPFRSKRQEGVGEQSGPYLCTGYDVYMLNEPCVMCSMALVHARAKRLFFCRDNKKDGALKSKAKLQTIGSLNHHFEVFTRFW